ncbi:MAG: DEAD/DEAH box helicase family protein, partial [Desulfosalsimonas sp.]
MELKLYNRLCRELLGDLGASAHSRDPEYQALVEAYAPQEQTGVSEAAGRKIRAWTQWYNRLQGSDFKLRYYQILALYFTEHVLECKRYGADFADQKALVYWMATGSGKTLLMHINILQYIEHIGGPQGFDHLQIILTTPGVNLIEQHEQELGRFVSALNRECSNRIQLTIETTAALLNKEEGFFNLPERHGHYRLVLVDEGHIGLSSGSREVGAFKNLRQDLVSPKNSFLFEYSATYHGIAERHVREYQNQIVYDYNYYRFFRDGYGKDFAIQSIRDDRFADPGREEYENFMAAFSCLADKIHDHELLSARPGAVRNPAAMPARPLLAFMGNTVADPRHEGKGDEVSDIRKLLRFLACLCRADKQRLKNVFHGLVNGRLRLTRRPGVPDLVWLSWGEGPYWGLINVGNGEKFVAECDGHEHLTDAQGNCLVEIDKANILDEKHKFNMIDTPASPINVLIGSRKFAEGWNCFRVSVIGLINLGASRGNKIIQIFGRGVRLHGQNNDGKRRFAEHIQDYRTLAADTSPVARLRRLETLNVFSLKKSYLQRFLKGLENDLPVPLEYPVDLDPMPVTVHGKQVPFEKYREKLKAPRVGRHLFDDRLRIVRMENTQGWRWEYVGQNGAEAQTVSSFPISLDYRPDPEKPGRNIRDELYQWLEKYRDFLPRDRWRRQRFSWEQKQKVRFLVKQGESLENVSVFDILQWPRAVVYHAGPQQRGFSAVIALLEQIHADVLTRVRNTIINDINKRRYRMDEDLRQAADDSRGDFAEKQSLHLSCSDETEKDRVKKKLDKDFKFIQQDLRLDFSEKTANFHIYGPLFDENLKQELAKHSILNLEAASPPLLNSGESKFVRDLSQYLRHPRAQKSRYEFYLMRNEAAMRSVGIYLETELQAFFPDFVFWIVDEKNKLTHIVLVDPKGQTGIVNQKTLGTNEKVNIAVSGHLDELAKKLTAVHGRKFAVHSFILLRDSSPLGTQGGGLPDEKAMEIIEAMKAKNVFRLDWSGTKEDGSKVDGRINGQTYLDMMFEKIG